MTALLTADEATALAENERVIERGITTFVEVGTALGNIRDGRLYRAEFGTFEDYAEKRWGLSRRRAYQFIEAAEGVKNLSHEDGPTPNESQARQLAKVPEPERADVWRETVERTNGKPTAAAIRATYRPDPDPEPEPEPDGPAHDDKRPDPEPGIWYGGPARPAPDEHAEADARRDAELDAAMEGTTQRFRANFARAARRAGEITTFDPGRTSEVFSGNWDRDVGDLLTRLRDWCDEVESTHRRRSSGLRIVGGSQ